MLWSKRKTYFVEDFENEAELEKAIQEVAEPLFGKSRVYLDLKKMIGKQGKTRNVPDGYLLDLSSKKEPKLYLVENELAKHDPLKHIAVQILEFSLAYETSAHKIKETVKNGLSRDRIALHKCEQYAHENGFENVDFLLERMIYPKDSFNALIIIDELSEELQTALIERFKFPVEIVTLQRYKTASGKRLYRFDPFLYDLTGEPEWQEEVSTIDPAEIDTIVVPAREEGFRETFIAENRWYAIRIHSSMVPKIKYIAGYQVSPVSAITHVAKVQSIEQWKDTSKYVVNFSSPARKITPIRLVPRGKAKAPQAPRYTSRARLKTAKTLDEVF